MNKQPLWKDLLALLWARGATYDSRFAHFQEWVLIILGRGKNGACTVLRCVIKAWHRDGEVAFHARPRIDASGVMSDIFQSCRRMPGPWEWVEEVDRLCHKERGISPGRIVLALMLDALSGRSPLFRLPQAFAKMDTELLLGEANFPGQTQ